MKRWYIAVVLIAALLLVGAAGAVKPVKEPVDKVVFVHYKDARGQGRSGSGRSGSFKLMGMKWTSLPGHATTSTPPTATVSAPMPSPRRSGRRSPRWDDGHDEGALQFRRVRDGRPEPTATDKERRLLCADRRRRTSSP